MAKLEDLMDKYEAKLGACSTEDEAMQLLDAMVSEETGEEEFDESTLNDVVGGYVAITSVAALKCWWVRKRPYGNTYKGKTLVELIYELLKNKKLYL